MSDAPEPDQINEIITAVSDTIREAMNEGQTAEEVIKRVSATLEEYLEEDDAGEDGDED